MNIVSSAGMSSEAGLLHMDPRLQPIPKISPPSSSRILYDIPCKVCRDHSSGKHYGIFACDGCAGFFKRSIRRNRQYVCKAKEEGTCIIDKTHRNQCRACRLSKCQEAGMNKDAVQHERGPRNSTLRRQMAMYFGKEPSESSYGSPSGPVLDLAIRKPQLSPSTRVEQPNPFINQNPFMCGPMSASVSRYPLGMPVPPPILTPPLISTETICESAARLLFMNVKWAKNVPAFTALPLSDQLLLLEESWRELFVLGAAQFLLPLDLSPLVHASGVLSRNPERVIPFLHEVKIFQETLSKFAQLQVDQHEFACLRAIVLFKTAFDSQGNNSPPPQVSSTSSSKTLTDAATVAALQDQTQLTLNKYIQTAHPGQPLRFGKLLLLLPALRSVSNNTIEELFFRRTIGNIPIEKIICDMYKASDI